MRHYYAISWPYGSLAWGSECGTPAQALAFETCADRDAWVSAGTPYTTQAHYREPISARDVRRHRLEIVPAVLCPQCRREVLPPDASNHGLCDKCLWR